MEKSLNELEGVDATVNFALKRATVNYDDDHTTTDDLAGTNDVCASGRRHRAVGNEAIDENAEPIDLLFAESDVGRGVSAKTVLSGLFVPLMDIFRSPGQRR